MHRIKRFAHWLSRRNPNYVLARIRALQSRYGITTTKAKRRVINCVQLLAEHDCSPTFPTPGRVIHRNAQFFRQIQEMGAELAVHGYDHLDFNGLSEQEASAQFMRAAEAFQNSGIRIDGFRCPYLSYSARLATAVPNEKFKYSSNQGIVWDVFPEHLKQGATAIFTSLNEFYQADSADTRVAVPEIIGNLVEIPVSVPDDLQIFDGLELSEEGVRDVWMKILNATHQRGEIFVAMFHPESYEHCRLAFESLLSEANRLKPVVWVAPLREISEWWWEKAGFEVKVSSYQIEMRIQFDCTSRATILIRNISTQEPTHEWHGNYRVLESRTLRVEQLPFIGLSSNVSPKTVDFLKEQGYLINTTEQARECSLYLDAATLSRLQNQVALIDYIESSSAPLARYWRWPHEYRSALCLTGDLDALSLMDYATRLFAS